MMPVPPMRPVDDVPAPPAPVVDRVVPGLAAVIALALAFIGPPWWVWVAVLVPVVAVGAALPMLRRWWATRRASSPGGATSVRAR